MSQTKWLRSEKQPAGAHLRAMGRINFVVLVIFNDPGATFFCVSESHCKSAKKMFLNAYFFFYKENEFILFKINGLNSIVAFYKSESIKNSAFC